MFPVGVKASKPFLPSREILPSRRAPSRLLKLELTFQSTHPPVHHGRTCAESEEVGFHAGALCTNIKKKGNAKECSNSCTIALISHASKVMLNILQTRLNSTWTKNFQMFKLDLEKAEEPEIKLPTSFGSSKKQESSRKTPTSALLITPKPVICVDHNKLWKIF